MERTKPPKPVIERIHPTNIPFDVLEKMEYTTWEVHCHAKGCKRLTHLRDYGSFPFLFHNGSKKWHNVTRNVFLCYYHHQENKKVPIKLHYPIIDNENKTIT